MPLMTPMMSPILFEWVVMRSMVAVMRDTTSPPAAAWRAVADTRSSAMRAASAVCRTVPEISSIDEAVSCRPAAERSVRTDRSLLPCATSLLATWIEPVLSRTSPTSCLSDVCMRFKPVSNAATSSRPSTTMARLRSPAATASTASTACRNGFVTDRVMNQAHSAPMAMEIAASATSATRVRSACATPSAMTSIETSRWCLPNPVTAAMYCSACGSKSESTRASAAGSEASRSLKISSRVPT